MANIISPHFGFRPTPVEHSPSPLSFGFGLSPAASQPGWQPPGIQSTHATQFTPSPSAFSPQPSHKTSQKRRHDDTDGDELMDRSPTPERRPIRPLKQMRIRTPDSRPDTGDHNKVERCSKSSDSQQNDSVDVGMLLASLPPQSLLPILTSLLSLNPSLKPSVLSLIPRPTLDTALRSVNQAAKKLMDEYPYSTASSTSFSNPFASASFGFGGSSFSYNRSTLSESASSSARTSFTNPSQTGMREEYVLSRLRPHITDFVTTVFSYMPYFSYESEQTSSEGSSAGKERMEIHPSETFGYLSAVTTHFLNQPPLCQSSLAPLLIPRLLQEWRAWVDRVDAFLKQGNMIRSSLAENWAETLDGYSEVKITGVDTEVETGLRDIRDRWVTAAGWLIGRSAPYRLE